MENPDDCNLAEIQENRMSEIQDLSDVVAIANLQLNKLIQQLDWSRKQVLHETGLVRCCFEPSHQVSSSQANDHNMICSLRYYGFNDLKTKDIPPSSLFCYEGTSVVPVELDQDVFQDMGVKQSFKGEWQKEELHTEFAQSLIETNEDINLYKPCDLLDELRFIYSWVKIPTAYCQLNTEKLPPDVLQTFLKDKLLSSKRCTFSIEQALILLTSWLKELTNPDKFTEQARSIFKNGAEMFVLDLWKFVYAKSLCIGNDISEHTRKEFQSLSVGNTRLETDKNTTVSNISPPSEWLTYNLTREQRLSLYERVCEIGRMVNQNGVSFEQLLNDTEEQMRVVAAFAERGEKTHLEVMAELRDYKRRRQSYRGKNNMTKKLFFTEVLRDLIEQQMLYLTILYQQQQNEVTSKDIKPISGADVQPISSADDFKSKSLESSRKTSSRNSSSEKTRVERRSQDSHKDTKYTRARSSDRYRHRDRRRSRSRDRSRSRERRYRDKRDHHRRDVGEISNVTVYED